MTQPMLATKDTFYVYAHYHGEPKVENIIYIGKGRLKRALEETKEKIRQTQIKRYEDPVIRNKASIAAKKIYEDPAARQRHSEIIKKSWVKRHLNQQKHTEEGTTNV